MLTSRNRQGIKRSAQKYQQMLALGKVERFEFKRGVDAVSVKLRPCWPTGVDLDPDREVARLLVGVDKIEHPATGIVLGESYGLMKGAGKAMVRIHGRGANRHAENHGASAARAVVQES